MNNVGSMSQFLYAYKNPNYDDVEAARWQAAQVSAISLMNFSGRIFIGEQKDLSVISILPSFSFPFLMMDVIRQDWYRILSRIISTCHDPIRLP